MRAAAVLAGALVLAGCSGAATPPPSVASVSATPPAPTSVATSPSSPVSQAAPKCTLDTLEASVGRTTGEAGQRHTTIVWTNTSKAPCTMTGFGGVDLKGPADPTFGPTYSLPRAAEQPTTVRLAAGAAAHTVITWLPPQDGSGWTPTGMLVTPPDETRSAELPWPGGAVLRQDGATHPGTFLGPVGAGAEG
ncbi:hypothetical protein GCM10023175_49620 [Pseudonocardia xishanensis]|uniref:DUF4232 domain-containing protein n=1 Tax=Pseudonocardia xishanensis TaxID=630995 RepID=A0ABP8RXH0_9PSEU